VRDPRLLAAQRDLLLVARTLVDGALVGVHPSRLPGSGLEFSQYRSYQPGDDLRRVDWKLLARSDRYFIREAERETAATVRVVLDATGSMAHAEEEGAKLDVARVLAAALLLVAHRQGDAIGLVIVRDGGADVLPPLHGSRQLHRLLHRLQDLTAHGAWPDWPRLEPLLVPGARGITVLLTDLHEAGREIRDALRRVAAAGHDVLVLALEGRHERDFDYEGAVTLEDLETGERVAVSAAARAEVRARRAARAAALRDELLAAGVQVVRLGLDAPLEEALRRALEPRARAARAGR